MNRTPRRPTFRPQTDALETRSLMAVFAVTTNARPYGVGTLNWAINEANRTRGADTIVFQIPSVPGQGVTKVIAEPEGGFPVIDGKVTINGFTQPGSKPNTSANPLGNNTVWGILLVGSTERAVPVLTIGPGGSGSEVRGIVFGATKSAPYNSSGVLIDRANLVKVDGDGFAAAANSGLADAVRIEGGSFNTIGTDIAGTPALQNIMNSYQNGVTVRGVAQHNAIVGNVIGGQTSTGGTLRLGLGFVGASNNLATLNYLVGNLQAISDGGIGNVIQGNTIIPRV